MSLSCHYCAYFSKHSSVTSNSKTLAYNER